MTTNTEPISLRSFGLDLTFDAPNLELSFVSEVLRAPANVSATAKYPSRPTNRAQPPPVHPCRPSSLLPEAWPYESNSTTVHPPKLSLSPPNINDCLSYWFPAPGAASCPALSKSPSRAQQRLKCAAHLARQAVSTELLTATECAPKDEVHRAHPRRNAFGRGGHCRGHSRAAVPIARFDMDCCLQEFDYGALDDPGGLAGRYALLSIQEPQLACYQQLYRWCVQDYMCREKMANGAQL